MEPLKQILWISGKTCNINKGLWSKKRSKKLYLLGKRPQSSSMYLPDKKSLQLMDIKNKDLKIQSYKKMRD